MRIAMIGSGLIAFYHARAIKSLGHELVMVSDVDEKRASHFAAEHNCSWTTENEKLLAQQVELITVAVPNARHFEAASAAVAAGHAVLCEKPMTSSAADSRRLVETVRRSGRPFFVGYMKRAHPTTQMFAEYAPRIGTPRSGLVRCYQPSPAESFQHLARSLAENPDATHEGIFVNGGSHMLDLLLRFAGPVKRVMAARFQYRPGCDGVDCQAHAMLEMENGATVMVEVGNLALFGVGRRENGWEEFVQLRGEEGLATLHTTYWSRPESESPVAELWHEPTKTRKSFNAGAVDYFGREYQLIERAFAGEEVPLATVEDGCRVDELIEEIFKAGGVR